MAEKIIARVAEHTTEQPAENKTTAPIMSDENVKELLNIMQNNNVPTMRDLLTVLNQVGAIEKQLEAAVNELAAMRRDLAEAQKQNHPVKNSLQKTVINMQGQVLDFRDKLASLRENIINGCKNAVAAFKEKGLSALRNITEFFNIRPGLESIRDGLESDIKRNDASLAKITAISTEYHETGRHLKNIGRAMTGKEVIQEAAPPGKLAAAVAVPYRAMRSSHVMALRSVNKAISAIGRLEKTERKPPIMESIKNLDRQIKETEKKAPIVVRVRAANHDER